MTAQPLTHVHDCSSHTDYPSSSLTPAIQTALIANSPLLRSGLQQVLQGTPFVLTRAASAADPGWLQHLPQEPALIIIDANRSVDRSLQMVSQVRERHPTVRIVALADQFDLSIVRQLQEAGVTGFCLAAKSHDVLIRSLELVTLGETVVPFEVLRSVMDQAPQDQGQPLQDNAAEPKLADLTGCKLSLREAEILGCLREGAPNKVIARKLDITEATIKVHVKAILRKLGLANRTQAAMWASQRLTQRGETLVNG
jgi:two-component system, NarL family, nitrate/nitrite response regulator NarL